MKKIRITLNKILLCIIIFLTLAIICKKNISLKEKINYELYQNHLSFTRIKEIYNHYLGGIMPLENITPKKSTSVFKEKITYSEKESYLNGVQLKVQNNYLVPNQESGVVVYVGKKEGYNDVVIIEGKENINKWYGNLCNISVKLYDYIEEGSYLGETCNEYLYLVYTKNNNFLNYDEYLS